MKNIDCKGLSCPQPVVEIKKIVDQGVDEALCIEVDNYPAKENVVRFLKSQGIELAEIKEENDIFTIITKAVQSDAVEPVSVTHDTMAGVTYIIDKDSIGKGDEELGKKLLIAFQNTLPDYDSIPRTLFFMNKGVYFSLDDSPTLDALKQLEERGVEIIVCGTCTGFFDVTDRVTVGILGNMFDLIDLYNREKVVTL